MQLSATLALGASVSMHVAWNLMARQQKPETHTLWWVLLAYLCLLAPLGVFNLFQEVRLDHHQSWLLTGSAISNALYFFSLRRAYALAPVALVYPLVRSSPLLIALFSAGLLNEALPTHVWVGICVSVLGLLLMAGSVKDPQERSALRWAFIAMLCTCGYSLTDRAGTRELAHFASLLGYLSFGYLFAWIVLTLEMRVTQGHWIPKKRPPILIMLLGGLFVGLAYALVIYAMKFMPVAVAVAYSNAGIVLACLISILVMKETHAWRRRMFAALIICTGLFLIT